MINLRLLTDLTISYFVSPWLTDLTIYFFLGPKSPHRHISNLVQALILSIMARTIPLSLQRYYLQFNHHTLNVIGFHLEFLGITHCGIPLIGAHLTIEFCRTLKPIALKKYRLLRKWSFLHLNHY